MNHRMPFLLRDRDIASELATVGSVLIVPCRFCPAASLAVRERKAYIQLFRTGLRTPSYEAHIRVLKSRLEREGIRTAVFESRLPHQFVVCMWTAERRQQLAQAAAGYDAAIVLGCDAAVETIRSALQSTACRVIQAMEVEGIMNVIPTMRFPFTISLAVSGVTRVLRPPDEVGAPPTQSGRR
jgi:hypothetical protein